MSVPFNDIELILIGFDKIATKSNLFYEIPSNVFILQVIAGATEVSRSAMKAANRSRFKPRPPHKPAEQAVHVFGINKLVVAFLFGGKMKQRPRGNEYGVTKWLNRKLLIHKPVTSLQPLDVTGLGLHSPFCFIR